MITRYQLPTFIARGVSQSLSLDVYNDAGAQQTASSGTVTIYKGGSVLSGVDTVAVTTTGPPAAYTLGASSTSGESLSDRWLLLWSLTISGTAYTFRQPAYLVRHVLYPTITDTDITDRYDDLDDYLDSDTTTFQTYRDAAWVVLNRDLIKRGRRPELIIDSYAVAEAHLHKTCELIFRDFASKAGVDGRYRELQRDHADAYLREWDTMVLQYDSDEDGMPDEERRQSGQPVVWLSRPVGWTGPSGGAY